MPNTYERGSDMLLKIDTAVSGGPTYTTVGGLQTKKINLKTGTVDVTNGDSASKWRELLEGAAIKMASLSGSGPLVQNDVGFKAARDAFTGGLKKSWQIIVPGFATITGLFILTQLDADGQHAKEITYSLTLDSAGVVTVTDLTT